MGNGIVAAHSSAPVGAPDIQTVSSDSGAGTASRVESGLTESAVVLLREELERAGATAARQADPQLAARLHGIYGLLLMARRMAALDRLRPVV